MKHIFTLLFIIICLNASKAQTYVTISDTTFVTWLNSRIPSAMNGNQMDITSPVVITRTNVTIGDTLWGCTTMDGIQYFTSLKVLNIQYQAVTSITSLPNTLEEFYCKENLLNALPTLPTSLQILDFDNNELTVMPLLPANLKILSCSHNSITTISSLPSQLDSLTCNWNLIASITSFPNSLKKIDCGWNQLTSLPSLPINLLHLSCYRNALTSLPNLPQSLLSLDCNVNPLGGGLPTLPNSLTFINCSNNNLISLPSLPTSLKKLECGANALTSLPTLPTSINYLDVQVNHLTSLPNLPNSLEIISCPNNQLIALPILPYNINRLSCSHNSINVLPNLPNSLTSLDCSSNQISTLPTLPSNLTTLIVSSNSISILPSLPSSLWYLHFSNNNISVINSIPNSVIAFDFSSNQLTSLPSLPPFLESIQCHHNNISCFPSFPNSITYFNILNNPFSCLPNYSSYMDAATLAYPICAQSNTVTNPNSCPMFQGIQGMTYNDQDNNCIKTTDQYVTNISLKLYDNFNTLLSSTYTFGTGIYNFAASTGTYNVVIDTIYRPYKVICIYPGIDTLVTLTSTVTTANDVNFPVNCKPGFDVGVQSVLVNGFAFPGQTHTLSIVAGDMSKWYHMNCAMGVSGNVAFTVSGPVTYISPAAGALTPLITGNIYSYPISDFGAISNSNSFQLVFSTDTTAQLDDNICITVTVTPTSGDNDSSNNIYSYCYVVSNSHDPNKKEVYPVNVAPNFHDWLTYTIHFQNTGNAPAMNIRIADTLNTNLDISTFQVINYSHINQVDVTSNILNVHFPNIQLPDSNINLLGSQGFVQYRIKPKANLPAGTKISNTAYIYFDFNSPIITNTTINNFVTGLSVNDINFNTNISIYPNPTNDSFEIETQNLEFKNIQIIDVTGNIIFEKIVEGFKNVININNLANGIYTLKISGEYGAAIKKLVIVK